MLQRRAFPRSRISIAVLSILTPRRVEGGGAIRLDPAPWTGARCRPDGYFLFLTGKKSGARSACAIRPDDLALAHVAQRAHGEDAEWLLDLDADLVHPHMSHPRMNIAGIIAAPSCNHSETEG